MKLIDIVREYRNYSIKTKQKYKWLLLIFILPLKMFTKQSSIKEISKEMYTIF